MTHHDDHDHHEHSHHSEHPHGAPIRKNLLSPGGADLTDCPVMPGSTVVKADAEARGLFRDYEGNRYWFCCAACGPLFDANPAKYAAAA